MPTEDYMNDAPESDFKSSIASDESLDCVRHQEYCSFCRQPQADWPTLLAHYDTCTEIQRTRLML